MGGCLTTGILPNGRYSNGEGQAERSMPMRINKAPPLGTAEVLCLDGFAYRISTAGAMRLTVRITA